MKYPVCLCLVYAMLFTLQLRGQNNTNTLDSLTVNLVQSVRAGQKEKVILQTDRKVYAAGERIWFNALLVKALNNRLASTSKNLFVDLVNDKDSVVKQLVLNVASHRTDGAIDLADSLAGGYYWLRSYTRKIISEGAAGMALQPLYIVNPARPATARITQDNKMAGGLSINFFPEGGALITGMDATGVLQVKTAGGNGVVAGGYIVDNHDSVITRFTTNRFGLAKITFYPKWFLKYRAVVHTAGQDIMYPITAWNPFAAQISVVKQEAGYLQAHISLEDSIYDRRYTTYILGLSRDSVCFAGIGRGMCQVNIPVENFPGGIATLLLFNEDKQLVSERKVFIDRDNFRLDIKTDKPTYAAREQVNLSLAVQDAAGIPMVAALNIAVEDSRVMEISDQVAPDSLLPAGLLSGDWLKRNKGLLTKDEIDMMMMAQPPAFKMPAADKTIASIIPEDDNELLVNLKGKVYDAAYKPLPGAVVTGIIKDGKNTFVASDTTGGSGGFRLHLPADGEGLPVMVQVTNAQREPVTYYRMDVDTFSMPKIATPPQLKETFSVTAAPLQAQITKINSGGAFTGTGGQWLAPVNVETPADKGNTQLQQKKLHQFSHIITHEMITKAGSGLVGNTILSVPGITVKMGYLSMTGGDGRGGGANAEPMVVVNGAQVPLSAGSDVETDRSPVLRYLNSLNAAEVDYIEVQNGAEAAAFGLRGGNGVILVYTKTDGNGAQGKAAALKIITPKTYHTAPVFYMPDYSVKELKGITTPDQRNTIYWAGNLLTDVNGKAQVSFYTADAPTEYTIVVTGITANGENIYKRISINRK